MTVPEPSSEQDKRYQVGDSFDVNDISSKFHEWNGRVEEVLEDGYYCMVDWFYESGAVITFDYFIEGQMASKVDVELFYTDG